MKELKHFFRCGKTFTPIYIRLNNELIADTFTSEQVDMLITVLTDNILCTSYYSYIQSYFALTIYVGK